MTTLTKLFVMGEGAKVQSNIKGYISIALRVEGSPFRNKNWNFLRHQFIVLLRGDVV